MHYTKRKKSQTQKTTCYMILFIYSRKGKTSQKSVVPGTWSGEGIQRGVRERLGIYTFKS